MPRMQVYLPTDLYGLVEEHRLPASELLQEAVRTNCVVANESQRTSAMPPKSRTADVLIERVQDGAGVLVEALVG